MTNKKLRLNMEVQQSKDDLGMTLGHIKKQQNKN